MRLLQDLKQQRTKINMDFDVIDFLSESNAIEGVHDSQSLDQAVLAWKYLTSEEKLTKSVILKTHKILMLHHLFGNRRGYYRSVNVVARKGGVVIKRYPEWSMVNFMMNSWINQVKVPPSTGLPDREIFLMEWVKKCHIDYEEIHPFIDGNGRTGRMFMNWQRLKLGLPILVIKVDEREAYYKWFK